MLRLIFISMLTLQSSALLANCELQLASLVISCQETATLLKKLPTLHESITAESTLRKITQTPQFTRSKMLSSITIEFEFKPHYKDDAVASYVYAICHSSGSEKLDWNCSTTVFNEIFTSKMQRKIKFQDTIGFDDAKEIIEIIDDSRKLWPRKCFYDDAEYSELYISSVFKNGDNFEVGFCTGKSSGKVLVIARDLATMTLYEKGVKVARK